MIISRIAVICFCLSLSLAGCDQDKTSVPVGQPAGYGEHAEEGATFESLSSGYHDTIAAFPLKSHSEWLIKGLIVAAEREGIATDEKSLMVKMADDPISLYLFERSYANLGNKSTAEALAFAANVEADTPDTPLAALAYDKRLLQLRDTDSGEFLDECKVAVEGNRDKRRVAVALLRRAEFYGTQRDITRSIVDYLHFWALFPEKVAELGLPLTIQAQLKEGGYFWEARTLELYGHPELAADRFYRQAFDAIGSDDDNVTQLYWTNARVPEQLLNAAGTLGGTSLDEIEFAGRVGCAAMHVGNQPAAETLLTRCGTQLLAYFASSGGRQDELAQLSQMQLVVLQDVLRCFSNYKNVEINEASIEYNFSRQGVSELVLALGQAGYEIVVARATTGAAANHDAASAVEGYVKTATILNDRRTVAEAYEDIVYRYKDTELAPQYLFKLGTLYDESWNLPTKAMETYSLLLDTYPNASQTALAHAKLALLQYKSEKYDDAYSTAQEYIAVRPQGEARVAMKFVSAMCESAMGMSEEAETHMMSLAEEHRESPVAARALFWVASSHLATQDYEGAKRVFVDLVERFPESPSSGQAKEYIQRISAMEESSGG